MMMTIPIATMAITWAFTFCLSMASLKYEPSPGTRNETPPIVGGASDMLRKNQPPAMETMLL